MRLSSARSIEDMSTGVLKAMLQLVEVRSGVKSNTDVVDARDEFGHDLFVLWRAMMSFKLEANIERTVLGNSRLVPHLSKLVVANSARIIELVQSGLLLQNALISYALEDEDIDVAKESPLLSTLTDYANTLRAATQRLLAVLQGSTWDNTGGGNIQAVADDVNVGMQKCLDEFLLKRGELVRAARAGSTNSLITSANFRVYHLVYALSVFSRCWTDIESMLVRRDLPMELIPQPSVSTESSPIATSRPHLRSVTRSES
ncbi:hypothetical protein Pmar_PMAR021541 [Perkinsus marinus ATCC 50983]|uniref:Uncharacterized protein n=1 Tax=Perkinsus marinus (strain ATCC 50983 / TXsc) TaxID=423536 RepID=C5LFW7_PERM5|nr:hypothetical protein Pmar_PMAR021541 [Perkinsus marinus ATCC 50983]EER04384.1 hypothetical protein Pmar_PMAR021541 [Perkinsus marinus ATCC 50983]|eukprot:XP_002772568.1 hypothetical protein Pmar_PMAR021541 [Perkinsus marinus ATCC 50983]